MTTSSKFEWRLIYHDRSWNPDVWITIMDKSSREAVTAVLANNRDHTTGEYVVERRRVITTSWRPWKGQA